MDTNRQKLRAPVRLIATNSLWVAGFQGLFGDPCGVDIIALPLAEALTLKDPEVILIDSGSFRAAGSLRKILERFRHKCPSIRLIVIGAEYGEHDPDVDSLYIQGLILAGAKGFLRPSARPEEFAAALQWVRGGSIWAPRQVLSRLVQSSNAPSFRAEVQAKHQRSNSVSFTPREAEVLRFLVGGQCNREIGESLGIGPVTVKAHLGRIMRKAGVGNRIELTMYALNGKGDVSSPHPNGSLQP